MCTLKFCTIKIIRKTLFLLASAYSSSHNIIVTINESDSAAGLPHTAPIIEVSYGLDLLKIKPKKTSDKDVLLG
jgi:hypothetical protein